jgi:hypothetical protein
MVPSTSLRLPSAEGMCFFFAHSLTSFSEALLKLPVKVTQKGENVGSKDERTSVEVDAPQPLLLSLSSKVSGVGG